MEQVGVNDDFFELGGHSLLAVRLISAIRKGFEVEIPISHVFDYPTVALLAGQLASQSTNVLPPIEVLHPRPERIPLSFSQERLWFIDRFEGGVQYHVPAVLGLKGRLSKEALEFALKTIVSRHEVLRTVFIEENGQAWQKIKDQDQWQLKQTEGQQYKEDRNALQQYIQQLINEPFDLTKDDMLRAELITIAEEEHVLVVTLHHIASDGWSRSILVNEVAELYAAFEENRPVKLEPLTVQYADYALWQRKYLQGEVLDNKLQYWKETLADVEPLQLPTDYQRPAVLTTKGSSVGFRIDKEQAEALQRISQQQGATLFMTLLAAFKVLLYRYTGQKDLCIGTPIAGRQQQEVEGLIGFFLNTLALRTNLNSQSSFTDYLREVKSTTMEAYEHQEVPFEKVVDAVVKERDMSRTPLFQVMFILQNSPEIQQLKLGELQLSPVGSEHQTAKFEIVLSVTETANGLVCTVEYNTNLYGKDTIERMIRHYQELVGSIVQAPDQKIASLKMLTKTEEQQLLVELNNTTAEYPKDKTIVSLFEEQVEKTSDNIAVVFEDRQLTYRQLNERANRLARHLQERGVRQETLVPICMERSLEMIVGILAILKAGGTYVPIDPEYPQERIRYMLEDSGASLFVASATIASSLDFEQSLPIVFADGPAEIATLSSDNLLLDYRASQTVCIVYTSGSTGRPKGVKLTNAGIVNRMHWMWQTYPFEDGEKGALKTSIGFVDHIWELFGTLTKGVPSAIFTREDLLDPDRLLKSLSKHKITRWVLVPSLLRALLDKLENGEIDLPYLKSWTSSGEALTSDLVEDFYRIFPSTSYRLLNIYGSSEVTADVTCYDTSLVYNERPKKARYQSTKKKASIPIGKPISNSKVYILDENNGLLPFGCVGEICIAGVQVSGGYLNKSELSAEKFIEDPFDKQKCGRLYKTGDLGRWMQDENLEYLGRRDSQVKIRGNRVELGEVETVLVEIDAIGHAAVVAKEDSSGNGRLIAYIVVNEGFDHQKAEAYLAERLPEYMRPRVIRQLESLPLTGSGKIDKKALAASEAGESLAHQYVAPRYELEKALGEIWQQLLKVEKVGIHDNFFELGGHSLLATRVVSAIRKRLEVEVAIKDLFIHPTVAELSTLINEQSKGLLQPPIAAVQPRPAHIPLSFSQERLWFIDKLEGSIQYHLSTVLRLKGKLNKGALAFALKTIVSRHEVLRTVFIEQEGQAWQQINDKDQWQVRVTDGSEYKEDRNALQQYIQQLINEPFDLSKDDMMRAALIKLDEEEYVLVVTLHHIASDGWSRSILVKEVVELYAAFEENRPVKLEPLPVQYADYALWQRKYLQGEDLDNKLQYWKDKLQDVEPLQLPTNYARPAVQSTKGAVAGFMIEKDLSFALQQVSQQHGATLFMTLLAAFKVLLYRYTGQQDICVGTPIAGRQQQELEGLIGFFLNTLALRTSLSSEESFTELLQQVKTSTLEAYEHQEVPFEKVVEAVVKERDMSRTPLFQVMFILQNTPEVQQLKLGELQLSAQGLAHGTAKFEITLSITETAGGLVGSFEYNTDLYSSDTIDRMIGHYKELITSIAEVPHQKIATLPMLTKAEEHQLLLDFNDTKAGYSKDKSIIDLFEEQVTKSPDAIAVVFEEERLNYEGLNARANQLAHYLRKKGVQQETLVPICIERSLEMMVGILGILKAGGAYVPIDPEYPLERIKYMLEDTGAKVVITSKEGRSKLPELEAVEIIEIDEQAESINSQPSGNPLTAIKPHHLAYIIYTSGSTGKPKGVMIEHSNVYSFIYWCQQEFAFSKFDVVYASTSICFDLSVYEIFYPLTIGKKVRIIENGLQIGKYLAKDRNVLTNSVPVVIESLLKEGTDLGNVNVINMAGEPIPLHVQQGLDTERIEVRNLYGPTEDTTYSTIYKVVKDKSILIGRPISNTSIYITGKENELMPIGVAGEICIGGDGLARGYLNRPELTAEKFIKDPFSKKEGSRLYRTGDLGRWLRDGNIEYLGRIDEQAKIRGYRIEPGEIETVLEQSGLVQQAVVVAKEDSAGEKRLVGYVVSEEGFNKQFVLTYLSGKLPDYMIPAIWVRLESFPLTPNGKIDKAALPIVDYGELATRAYVAPRNEVEEQLVTIWQAVLKVERVGVEDDFFELGGHSLLAMRVVSAIRKQMEVDLEIRDLFVHPAIAQLSVHIRTIDKGTALPAIVSIQPKPERIPLSFSQERLWFIDKLDGTLQYHLPATLRLKGALNTEALEFALQNIVNRHEVLRTVFREEDGVSYQLIQGADKWQLLFVDGRDYKEDNESLRSYLKEFINHPFDLSCDYMLRACVIRLDKDEHILSVVLHHIASDGWSTAVFVKEVVELYSSFEENRGDNLLPLPVQYADYAIWQRSYLQGDILNKKLQYWKEKLHAVTPLQLPTDFVRQAFQSTNGAVTTFSLDKDILQSLHLLSKQQDSTLFMTLLSAFNVLLYRYSGQADICIGVPVANRTQHEVEELIGFFVNTLALRNQFNGQTSFFELLQTVRSTTLQAYEHQDVPFEKVVDEVVKERDMSRSPLFQVMFVLQNTPDVQELKLGDVQLLQEASDRNKVKFELTLSVIETKKGLIGSIEYNTDLYTEATIGRMIEHYKVLIGSIVRNPELAVEALQMLTKAEEQQLLVDFNQTKADYPKEKSVIDLFEAQVVNTPQATAIVYSDEQINYYDLNARANQLAHYLRTRGVNQESLVPICLERSTEMVVAIIGILKAGAAYIPIDPEYPNERIQYILGDTSASVILTNSKDKIKIAPANNIEVIDLERDSSVISRQQTNNLKTIIEPHQLAYIIYTSGSTGRPKGVMIEHQSIVNLITYQTKKFGVEEDEKILQFSNYSFDASVEQIFIAFCTGSTLVVAGKELVRNPEKLLHYIINNRITHFHCTPTYLTTVPTGEYGSLKRVIAGGEQCSLQLAKSWGKKVDFFNEYGPTETTVTIIEHQFSFSSDVSVLPIGKPISNTNIYILGEGKQLQPIGIAGEIYIGGVALSRGYLNLSALTAEKFVNDSFGGVEGSRLYRTGDVGRWLYNGTIEYLGRIDDQVKIRGYRIELGEIESVLLESGLVDKAVVLVKEDSNGNKRLVGYIVTEGFFDKQAITNYLHARIPEYMVPALWLELETLPLTANGKIDTKFLLSLDAGKIAGNEYVRPESEEQVALAEIWQHLLAVERVGIHDNFFELGGDSITTIQVVSRANKLGYSLQPKDIFIHQTIAGLSVAIAERTGKAITAEQGFLTGASGLLPIQQWYLQNEEKEVSHFNQSILISIDKSVTEQILDKAVKQLIIYHDALRFRYYRQDGQWQQEYGTAEGGILIEDLRQTEGALSALITEQAVKYQQSLSIEQSELIRVVLIQTPQTEAANRLLIIIHHLAIDGVSWRILLEDFDLLLTSLTNNEKAELGNKSSSYRQWYKALEQYGLGEKVISQKGYWQETLKSYLPIKTDTEYAGEVRIKDTARYSVRLGVDETRRLLQEVPAVYHTEINDLLLSALAQTLCDWSETDRVVIGLEGHGREDIAEGIDTSRTVGWFTNLYPVLLQAGKLQDNDELIKSVKEQLRRIPDKGMGYGVLKYINKEEELQNGECWDVVFNYFGQLDNIVKESRWMKGAGEGSGAMTSEELTVSEKLAVNGMVQSGSLTLHWSYSKKHFADDTLKRLAETYITNLTSLIHHCLQVKKTSGSVYTPSDYGIGAEVGFKELDKFLNEPYKGRQRKDAVEGIYRLSGLQQGMLFHGLYDQEAGAYIEQICCDLVGPDLELVSKSWQWILNTHTILRSAFYHNAFNIPVQCVYRNVDLPVCELDYRNMSPEERIAAIKEFEITDRKEAFDFKQAPLIRLVFIRISEDRYHMVLTMHHILFDGWSFPVLMQEFLSSYEALSNGSELNVIEQDRYEDYIRHIERADKHEEEHYWRNYLKGVDQSTLLPFINSTSERTKGTGNYEVLPLFIDVDATTGIQGYAQRHRLTVNTLMQGVWAYLLHKYTGNKNVVYGVVVSGRPEELPNVEQRVGLYINTLPLHSTLLEDQSVVDYLKHLQEDQVASRKYQHTPLNITKELTGVQGDLFDSILVFENYPVSKVIASSKWKLSVENFRLYEQTNYPLTLAITSSDHIKISFNYNPFILDPLYVQEIRDHFNTALLDITADQKFHLNDVKLLSPEKEHHVLIDFNNTPTATRNKNVVHLFEEQVLKNSDKAAVVFGTEQLTYYDLNEKANKLASYLINKGVKNETLVPLCFGRGMDMIISILGVIKAGGAYVPLDPTYPMPRITYMLEDTGANIVLANTANKTKLKLKEGCLLVDVQEDQALIEAESGENIEKVIESRDLVYVIYTSGSTGTPKGVEIEHRGLINLAVNQIDLLGLETGKKVLQFASFGFDASCSEIFTALLSGGTLIIPSKEDLLSAEAIVKLVQKHKIDVVTLPPSYQAVIKDSLKNIPLLISAGEQLNATLAKEIQSLGVRLFNAYGPTENTVCVTMTDHAVLDDGTVTIGKPIGNVTVYIVDEQLNIVPFGVPGELCVGGLQVARGYLNRVELTKEKFIKNPFVKSTGERIYRTGDLARWLPDGNIEYLGRLDEQLKVAGHRIECGEIEAVLTAHPDVEDAAVVLNQKEGNKKLVAFYKPVTKVEDRPEQGRILKKYLAEFLPEYMIPSAFIRLENIPVTANGKVDRKGLMTAAFETGVIESYVAPVKPTEIQLVEIWQKLLGVERVGIMDNFFELGGNSLLAMRMVTEIERSFLISIPIQVLFHSKSISDLSRYLDIQKNVETKEENTTVFELLDV